MARIDLYVGNLARLGATGVVLEGDAAILFQLPTGDRRANQTISQRDLTALVEEIIPVEEHGALLMGGPVAFDYVHAAIVHRVTVTPGRERWTVTISGGAPVKVAAPAPAPAAAPAGHVLRANEAPGTHDPAMSHLLGRLAVHYKLITMDQLDEVLREQGRRPRALGAILIERGLISPANLEKLLAAQAQYLAEQGRRPRAATPAATYTPASTRMAAGASVIGTSPSAPAAAPPPPAPAPVAPVAPASPPRMVRPTSSPERPITAPLVSPSRPSTARAAAVDAILARGIAAGASDILVHPDSVVRQRVAGTLIAGEGRFTAAQTDELLSRIVPEDLREVLRVDGEIDFTYPVPEVGRFRTSIYRQHRGLSGVFHFAPLTPPTLESLGLPQDLARVTTYPQGMVLVTGPAGCGKTSTLAALVDLINEERHDHILTIEDPIEYLHTSKRCFVNQRQVRRHTESFARALRAALREDPDVICIGELRDLETISLAMSAAETGHLVLATLHTNSAIRTINRIVGAFPSSQQGQIRTMLSESLRAVISQRLLPAATGQGVVAALEILHVNPAIGNLIRDNKTFQIASVLLTGRTRGQKALDHSLTELVQAGVITAEVAAANSDNPTAFKGGK